MKGTKIEFIRNKLCLKFNHQNYNNLSNQQIIEHIQQAENLKNNINKNQKVVIENPINNFRVLKLNVNKVAEKPYLILLNHQIINILKY